MPRTKKPKGDLSEWVSDIDIQATQKLIDDLQREGKNWDKLDIGKSKYTANYRRICPKRPEWTNPYQVTAVHYLGPNRRMVLCRKELSKSCPACDLRWELNDAGAKAEANSLRPSVRTFMNVVHINQDGDLEDDKVYLLGLNQIQFVGKRGVEYDPDEEGDLPLYNFFVKYGDLSHVEHGRDLLIKAKEDKSGDFDTTAMKFSVGPTTPFPGTSEMLKEGLTDITAVASVMDGDEMVATIEGQSAPTLAVVPTTQVASLPASSNGSRFSGGDDEEPEGTVDGKFKDVSPSPEVESAQEAEAEEKADAKASAPAPTSDPAAALKRLRANQEKD